MIIEKSRAATILVFIALPEEHDRLLEVFSPLETIPDTTFVYVEHSIQITDIRMISVLASAQGIDNAFDATAAALKRFEPNIVVCLGIAGSLTTDLKIGNVSVASEVIDISQNMKISELAPARKRRPAKRGRAPRSLASRTVVQLSPKFLAIRPDLTASFRFLRSHPTLKIDLARWADQAAERRIRLIGEIPGTGLNDELGQAPVAEIGPIISGPVVASSAFRETLKNIDRKVLCVETESPGVCRAAAAAGVPCITVRGISDHADVNKNALERTTKQAARQLASDNAISYFALQIKNVAFMEVALRHKRQRDEPQLFKTSDAGPHKTFSKSLIRN